MNFPQFTAAVDNLVREWATEHPTAGALPRGELKDIFDSVREQAVHDCAQWQEQREKALALIHSNYVKGGKK